MDGLDHIIFAPFSPVAFMLPLSLRKISLRLILSPQISFLDPMHVKKAITFSLGVIQVEKFSGWHPLCMNAMNKGHLYHEPVYLADMHQTRIPSHYFFVCTI